MERLYAEAQELLERETREAIPDTIYGPCRVIFHHVILILDSDRKAGWLITYVRYRQGEELEKRCAYIAHAGCRLQWDNLIWAGEG